MKSFLKLVFVVVLVLAAIVLTRAALLKPAPIPAVAATPIPLDHDGAVQRFIGAIQIPTESQASQPPNQAAMQKFRDYLVASFPKVNASMQREVLPDGALIYTWAGRDPSAKPVVLMGHFDVVPAATETLSQWKHGPYSGDLADGFIWGRGTLDDKIHVVSLLEAAETLIGRGFTPARTILFCFGDDEENGGSYGAVNIVKTLKSRNIQPEFVIDEGGAVARGMIPGLTRPVAVIGTAEKGFANLDLTTHGTGGHSSEPPRHTAIGELGKALGRLEDHQFYASLPGVLQDQYTAIAPYMPFSKRLVLANLWLFKPLIVQMGLKQKASAGNFHTTIAEDMISGGFKDNALPTSAKAVINFRILPGDTVATVIEHVRKAIDDPDVTITDENAGSPRNPSPISPIDSNGYLTLSKTIHQLFPDVIVVPNLLAAATDSTFYTVLTPNVYRFLAVQLDPSTFAMIHGLNERIAPEDYVKTVQFMAQLMQNIN